jgi:hypothetical protein
MLVQVAGLLLATTLAFVQVPRASWWRQDSGQQQRIQELHQGRSTAAHHAGQPDPQRQVHSVSYFTKDAYICSGAACIELAYG